jgi:PhzF family phenazine biosynthesis protein
MKRIPCWQVDAFTDRPFAGNPAAVCWLEREADAVWMQAVATEMNLSETAFARCLADGIELRWFTPGAEVELCGHATLATAHVLWTNGLASVGSPIQFHTRSGVLACTQADGFIELDFPALPAERVSAPPGLLEALGIEAGFVGRTKYDYLLVLASPDAVRACRPDFRLLGEIPTRGIIITSRADDPPYDFISRAFFPSIGVNEDPVCGSAHCTLAEYWGEQLGKSQLLAWQASARGGIVRMRRSGERVILGGRAITVWEGSLLH